MQTTCPECTSTMTLPKPDTDPGAFSRCGECGDRVQPGAFLCPFCTTGLQVEQSLLPSNGGHGRCPECSEAVWIPPLTTTVSETAAPEVDVAPAPAEMEEEMSDPAPHVFEEGPGMDEESGDAEGGSFLGSVEEEQSPPMSWPEEQKPAPGGRRGLGFFLGTILGAGAMVGVVMGEVWVPLPLPWDAEFPYANLITWVGASGLVGGLLGFLLGGSRRR